MIKRILIVWFIANFAIIGLASILGGRWYLGWQCNPMCGLFVQLCLVMLPNLLLPILLLRYWWIEPVPAISAALGWRWTGWRSILTGILAFFLTALFMRLISEFIGPSIPYSLPSTEPMSAHTLLGILGLLLLLLLFVGLTVAAEETMFRGLIQTQVGAHYRAWVGILVTVLLFGLRHLPDDVFYARVWQATPQMWISRQLQLYTLAIILSLARHFGRSTYSSAIVHAFIFAMIFAGV